MRKRLMFALSAALLGAMAAFGFVQATPGSGVTPSRSPAAASIRSISTSRPVTGWPTSGSRGRPTFPLSRTVWPRVGRSAGTATPVRA